ncbi:heat shock protein 21 [Penaeus vannamei]|uniref:Heat shock protein 21 n=1 Tax=Penaeus vannamei TaxID=6689 RepID=A0A3R7MHP6_PENVA|nr:heat shock protein 21 [Penaeus vannamei]
MSLLQSFASGQPVSESGVKCCNCGGVRRPWDMFLPITHRGSFFQDSFFSNLHQHFHATVRDILNRWCDSDLKLTDPWDDVNARHTDILDRYRQLRSRNLKEENQAVAVTSDDTSRKESEAQHKTTIIPIQMEETQDKKVSEGTSSESFKCEQCSQTQTSVNGGKQGVSVPIKNYDQPSEANKSQPKQTQITQESVPSSSSSRLIPIEIEANEANVNASANTARLSQTPSSDFQLKSSENDKMFHMDPFPGHFFPITRRGLFFSDSFFQDSWNDFQKAVREVLARWGDQSSLLDDLTSYRNLRSRDLREDTQAVTSSEDEHQHKHSTLQIEEVFSPISIDGSEKKLTSPGATKDNSHAALQNSQGSPMAPWTKSPGATAAPTCQQTSTNQTSNPLNKEDPYVLVTAVPARVEAVPDSAETPKPSSSSAPSKSASVKPKAFDRKGREGSEEEEKVDYKAALKPRTAGGKFPIKISGTVIGSDSAKEE